MGRHRRRRETGQIIVLFIGFVFVGLALLSLVIDGGLYLAHWAQLQVDLDAACMAAATAQKKGLNPTFAFNTSLANNGVSSIYYDPQTFGSDGYVIRGLQFGPRGTFMVGASGPHDLYLAQFMGVFSMDVAVRSRCIFATVGLSPIAVQEPWFEGVDDEFPDDIFPILGQGAEAVTYTGNDYGGAVIIHVWCVNALGAPDKECPEQRYFAPLSTSPSSNSLKDVVQGTIAGDVGVPYPPPLTRLPQISGVSNKFLVQTADERWDVGDTFIVIIYDGDLYKPSPPNGNWDNIGVLYYALVEVMEFDSNTLFAQFIGGPYDSPIEIEGFVSRVVPWTWYE